LIQLTALVWLSLLASALVQIGITQGNRTLVQAWQSLERESNELRLEQTRLVLELGTLTSYSRIDQRSRVELDMNEADEVRVLTK
jgi:cell division protein FtsL